MAEYQGKRFKRADDAPAPRGASASRGAETSRGNHAAPAHAARAQTSTGSHAAPTTSHRAAHAAPRQASSRAATGAQGVRPIARHTASAHTSSAGGSVPPRGTGRRGNGSNEGPRRRRILPIVLIVVGVVLLLAAGGIFVSALLGYQQAVSTYEELEEYAQVSDSEGTGIPVVDFDALKEINPDVVAWVYVPGTNINYPVVQGDDNTTYLTRLFDGTSNSSGSIFLDADAAAPGMVDQQTPLYGHHMNNKTMFYQIDETCDQAIFDEMEELYYITPKTTYRCVPLMTSVVQDTYVDARRANFSDALTLKDYLADLLTYAKAQADDATARIEDATQVVSLITCSSEIPTADRTVMVLTVEEETPTVVPAA